MKLSIGIFFVRIIFPWSILSFKKNDVKPIYFLPSIIDLYIGAAPLYSGRTDVWIFIEPSFGILYINSGNIL